MTGGGGRQRAGQAGPVRFDTTGSYGHCAASITGAAAR